MIEDGGRLTVGGGIQHLLTNMAWVPYKWNIQWSESGTGFWKALDESAINILATESWGVQRGG